MMSDQRLNTTYLTTIVCLTGWNISHFVVHFMAGVLAPDYFFLDFVIGTAFEFYEGSQLSAQDPMDLVCNVTGFWAGKYVVENYK